MGSQRCVACGERFTPCRHVLNQRYCAKPACQRARRRWRERHPDYWRKYRETHPGYTARNREQQRKRNRDRAPGATDPLLSAPIAKMDVYAPETPILSGTYSLQPAGRPGIAKMDAYLVKIQVLSEGYSDRG